MKYTSTNETEKIIKSLKMKNLHEYGRISTKILKLSLSYISSPLTYICNKMLSTAIFPTRLKYRRFYQHINCNHILVYEQFGFRNNSPKEIASYNLINDTLSSLNHKLLVGSVFCDLQKAYECVNHDIVLSKMEIYGISGKDNRIIKSD